jgi:hypothetical protein
MNNKVKQIILLIIILKDIITIIYKHKIEHINRKNPL